MFAYLCCRMLKANIEPHTSLQIAAILFWRGHILKSKYRLVTWDILSHRVTAATQSRHAPESGIKEPTGS